MDTPHLDLAEAVDRAARKWAELGDTAHRYDVDGIYRHSVRQHVLPIVQAAAPAIVEQTRAAIAADPSLLVRGLS